MVVDVAVAVAVVVVVVVAAVVVATLKRLENVASNIANMSTFRDPDPPMDL